MRNRISIVAGIDSHPSRAQDALPAFFGVVAAWFIPHGLQLVLFPWLLAVYLHLPPDLVGVGQSALQLPGLFLALLAGSLADRWDTRRLIIRLHLFAMVPPLCLAAVIWGGGFSFPVLLGYALVMGSILSFVNPTRDAMLAVVAQGNLQRIVTGTTGVQFGVQIIGYGIAMLAGVTGPAPLLLVQGVLVSAGAFLARRLPERPPRPVNDSPSSLVQEVVDGLRLALRSPSIAPVLLLSFCGSVLYLGSFFVLIPVLIRDVYHGGAREIGLTNIAFMAGTILMTVLMLRVGGIRRRGRAYMLANLWGAGFALLVISRSVPFGVMVLMLGVWGAAAGVGMSMSRTILQEHTPESHRARIFSIYQLCFMAGGPVGSVTMGYLVKLFGPVQAALLPPLGMAVVVTMVYRRTGLWHIDEPNEPAVSG